MFAIKTKNGLVTKKQAYQAGCFDPPEEVQRDMKKDEWYEVFQVGCRQILRDIAPLIVDFGVEFEIVEYE